MKMRGKVLGVFVAAVIAGVFCSTALFAGEGRDVTVKEAAGLVAEKKGSADFVLLDVRTPGEFAEGHLEGAFNIDVKAKGFSDEIMKLNKKKSYLIYCRSGKRSKRAQGIMLKAGCIDVVNMKGGFMAWSKEGHPFVK